MSKRPYAYALLATLAALLILAYVRLPDPIQRLQVASPPLLAPADASEAPESVLEAPPPTTEPPTTTTTEPPPPTTQAPAPVAPPPPQTVWPASMDPCGGDLPPCYVKARESGGSYSARNPSGACGAWQIIPSTWNHYGGYESACDAPPEVQDQKARDLWAGGAGCGHWSAC